MSWAETHVESTSHKCFKKPFLATKDGSRATKCQVSLFISCSKRNTVHVHVYKNIQYTYMWCVHTCIVQNTCVIQPVLLRKQRGTRRTLLEHRTISEEQCKHDQENMKRFNTLPVCTEHDKLLRSKSANIFSWKTVAAARTCVSQTETFAWARWLLQLGWNIVYMKTDITGYSMIHHQSLSYIMISWYHDISWYIIIVHYEFRMFVVDSSYPLDLFGVSGGFSMLFLIKIWSKSTISPSTNPNNIATKRGQKQKPSTSKFSHLQSSKMLFKKNSYQ